MFHHVVHCDWSVRAAGRWSAEAHGLGDGGWRASGPCPVAEPTALVDRLFAFAADGPTLAAFDFPIGFPAAYGAATGLGDFPSALDAIDRGDWPEIFDVATAPDEVGPRRPFYPRRTGGARLRHLTDGHGVAAISDLVRACERPGPDGGAAGCMFWTMGAKQVGKAALHGWREVIAPARARGAALWPFEGDLAGLARRNSLVLAESYPADALRRLCLKIGRKGDPAQRATLAPGLMGWASARDIALDERLAAAIRDGFPPAAGSDDGFDAVVGLFAAVAVARGEHAAAPQPLAGDVRRWEGWILGKNGRVAAARPAAPATVPCFDEHLHAISDST